jgi:hypothetical protein
MVAREHLGAVRLGVRRVAEGASDQFQKTTAADAEPLRQRDRPGGQRRLPDGPVVDDELGPPALACLCEPERLCPDGVEDNVGTLV